MKAIETLTRIGLDFFEDCAEYFLALSELSKVNWTLNSTAKCSSQLFEIGSGINVFAEEAFITGIYFRVLMTWLKSAKGLYKPMQTFATETHDMTKGPTIAKYLGY